MSLHLSMPLWMQALCRKKWQARQQAILKEIAELQSRRQPRPAKNNNVYSELCSKQEQHKT